MAAKSFLEVLERVEMVLEIKRALCIGAEPLAVRLDEGVRTMERKFKNEMRDFLAHEVARFCKRHDAMKHYDILTQFVQEVIKDLPVGGSK
jgi:hypothetical protein